MTVYLNIFPEGRKFPEPKGGVGLRRMTGLACPDLTMLDLTAFILISFSSVAPNRKLSSLQRYSRFDIIPRPHHLKVTTAIVV